ncbi:serine acetyltransferase [Aliarcobacter butzleri]|uniref:serine acetyltransferase n=1 Tax=Aliarcobacter butzleri TaxID=28197 RepID=UPI0019195678|nr:hypothetical protein [Aliarcobacter butzleri]
MFKDLLNILRIEKKNYIQDKNLFLVYLIEPRFRVNVYFRLGKYLSTKKNIFAKIYKKYLQNLLMIKYGFHTTFDVQIGIGLRIVHLGGINIHGNAIIGENFTVLDNVSIGQAKRRDGENVPTIGNDVYVGSCSKIVGKIKVGDNVTIGTMTLVNKDVADNQTVVGIPFKVISQ